MLPLKGTKRKFYSMALISLVLLIAYSLFFMRIMEKSGQVARLDQDLDTQLQNEERSRLIRSLVIETEDQRQTLDSYFVGRQEEVSFISTVESLGNASGAQLEITSVSVDETADSSNYFETLNLEFNAQGTWNQVYHVLTLTEHLPLSVTLEQFTVEYSDARPQEERWRGIFEVSARKVK